MERVDLPFDYMLAEGPEGLRGVLDTYLKQALTDPIFAAQEHYILYQLGSQKSVIKVDMSEMPYQFWYFDLLGRPATRKVKETIAQFIWDKCGGKEKFKDELEMEELT